MHLLFLKGTVSRDLGHSKKSLPVPHINGQKRFWRTCYFLRIYSWWLHSIISVKDGCTLCILLVKMVALYYSGQDGCTLFFWSRWLHSIISGQDGCTLFFWPRWLHSIILVKIIVLYYLWSRWLQSIISGQDGCTLLFLLKMVTLF